MRPSYITGGVKASVAVTCLFVSSAVAVWGVAARVNGGSSFPNNPQEPGNRPAAPPTTQTPDDTDQLRRTVRRLKAENERLRTKVAKVEQSVQPCVVRDRLTKEEQRGENLHAELFAIAEKEGSIRARLDEVTEQLRPANIDQLPIMGSTRPEEVRETIRRRLNNESMNLQSQLDLLNQNRMRIQSSLAITDMMILNLRAKLQSSANP